MNDYVKEKELLNQPKAIPVEELNILLELVKTRICKICKDKYYGTGFFCKIPIGWGNYLTVLMTNNHILKINDIQPGQNINFTLNNDDKAFNILIDNTRITYTSEYFDITIIEIKEDDKIDQKSFFDLDEQIFKENCIHIFKNCQIFLLHYPKGTKMEISPGVIRYICEDKDIKTIHHLCDTSGGSSGAPIINKTNFKVIGIHKGSPNGAENYNLGTLIKEPIEEFCKEIKIKKNNNIDYKYTINRNYYIKENEKIEMNKINNIEKNSGLNNNDEDIDEITIQYKIDDIDYSKDINIFGKVFVTNNKDKCKIIINGNEFELCKKINIKINQLNNRIFELKLKGINNITDISFMFHNCQSLLSFSKWIAHNATNMRCMFFKCSSLSSLPDISKWNTQNATDMSCLFSECSSLSFLPDISKWNTQNATNMKCLFYNCSSLSSLPDISKWNTQNVTNISYMFCGCSSLSSLPDISKWDTQNVTNTSYLFSKCSSLSSLPDISKWNIQKIDSDSMFLGCKNKIIPKEFKGKCCFIF